MTVKVAVHGYGTIGKRVADAVTRQSDMKLVGVAKTRPSHEARSALAKGYKLFLAGAGQRDAFDRAGIPLAGTAAEMIREADVVIDCAPDKVGRENARLYQEAKVAAIFQGGEKADIAEVSFSALANFEAARGKRTVRVVSCNTTGIARAAAVLEPAFGVAHWEATIVRRGADPAESHKGPINGILPTFKLPSHHGPDVKSIFPSLPITTIAMVVPTTLMHVHVNHVKLTRAPASASEVLERFRKTPRFHLFREWEGVEGTPQVMEFARDRGGPGRSDMMENALWENGLRLDGPDLYFFQAIHQESIVVPENIDAIRATMNLAPDAATSIAQTDRSLGIPAPE
ncbi:MAG: type II glyceraldehyde-3-phosphate dehydrogenase [Thermoplasmata archaeon]|nr:type II glyceraldehyde-3-phosphate dehydrogenase [Thermoplasmata archaeon]